MGRWLGDTNGLRVQFCFGTLPAVDDVLKIDPADATKGVSGKVATNNIGALAVTAAKLAGGAVDATKIAAGALDLTNVGLWTGLALGNVPDGAGFNKVGGVTAGHGITGGSFDTISPIDLSPIAATGIKSAGVPIHLGGKTLSGGALLPYSYVFDVATVNAILNPSFEVDTSNWSVFDTAGVSTIARETGASNFCVGVASAKVVTPANAGTHGIRHANIAALPGQNWALSAWISNGENNAFCRIEFLSAALAVLATTDGTKESSTLVSQDLNFFTRLGVHATAPASTAWVRFSIATTDVSTTFYVDGCQAEQSAQTTTYCDGTMGTGYSWSGTAHASTSSRLAGMHIIKPNDSFPFYLDTIGTPHALGLIVRGASGTEPVPADLNITVGDNALISANPCSMPTAPNPGSIDLCLAAGGPKGRVVIGAVAAGAGGLHVTGGGGSFPTTPSANDVFFRTDIGLLCYYDGTRWLTVQEYAVPLVPYGVLPNGIAATATPLLARLPDNPGGTQVYLTRWSIATNTAAPVATWTFALQADGGVIDAGFNTAADGIGVWVNRVRTINLVRTITTDKYWDVTATKAGGGNTNVASTVHCRLIVI